MRFLHRSGSLNASLSDVTAPDASVYRSRLQNVGVLVRPGSMTNGYMRLHARTGSRTTCCIVSQIAAKMSRVRSGEDRLLGDSREIDGAVVAVGAVSNQESYCRIDVEEVLRRSRRGRLVR
jgi:hypothetical protein